MMAEDGIPAKKAMTNGVDDTLPAGARCETKLLVERYNKNGECVVLEKDDKPIVVDPHSEYALVSKQRFNAKNQHAGTTLRIYSPQLLTALKAVVKYYPGECLDFDQKFASEDPFMMLVHYRKELAEYREKTDDDTAKMHIRLLFDYLDKEMGEKVLEIQKLLKASQITFPLLWLIFKPGELVYTQLYKHERVLRLRKTGYGQHVTKGKYFDLDCSFTSYDGVAVGKSTQTLRIWHVENFLQEAPSLITSLNAYPLNYHASKDKLCEQLAARGQRYLEIREMCTMHCDGLFLYLRRPPYGYYSEQASYSGTWLPETMSGRVIIDPKTFNEEARAQMEEVDDNDDADDNDEGKDDRNDDKEKHIEKEKEDLNSTIPEFNDVPDTVLCPPYVYGFSLEKKEWCKFFVTLLQTVHWDPNALDKLIIQAPQKRLLRGLVTSHKFPEKSRDEVTLKGKGLVILLHGSPGSGKTLTAEMTAEHTHRPLLNISTGELGKYEYFIEVALKRLLTLAQTFKAIVLIDEADVFLEARNKDQVLQNNLVAIFLRQLEYFQGIMFLTSNRVSVFDQAVKSRIHMALQYMPPDASVRRLIWRNHLARIPSAEHVLDMDSALDILCQTEMNGREISNAINTARTLAQSEGHVLSLEYLETIVRVWEEFERSLRALVVPPESAGEGRGVRA